MFPGRLLCLEVGGSFLVGLKKKLPPSKVTLSNTLYANRVAAYICMVTATSRVVPTPWAKLGCPLQHGRGAFRLCIGLIQAWAEVYGGQDIAHVSCPPSPLPPPP